MLKVLTFEAGAYLFAVSAQDVAQVLPPGRPLPEGTSVVDVVGLLVARPGRAERGCLVLLRPQAALERSVALTASRAREVVNLDPGELLPLPAFLFGGSNPFQGLIPPSGSRSAVFLLGKPERLLSAVEGP